MRYILATLLSIAIFGVPWFVYEHPTATQTIVSALEEAGNEVAAVLLSHNPKTIADLHSTYDFAVWPNKPKIKILIVPGHEPGYGGAEYQDVKERNLTVEIANDLSGFLANNPRYVVTTTRGLDAWNPIFDAYFHDAWTSIIAWRKAYQAENQSLINVGQFRKESPVVSHNRAPDNVAIRLFGIDKWSNENDIDIVIHIHLNDYPGHVASGPGDYNGFAIYVPEEQYDNSSTTRTLAQGVFKRLQKYNPVSDFQGEQTGIVPDQDLIAIGPFNSVNAASMLIEYAYIYEPEVTDPAVRPLFFKELAYETYLGLQDFFDPAGSAKLARQYDTLALPHAWQAPITAKDGNSQDIFAAQTAMLEDGVYPPEGKNLNDCPRTGRFGVCTEAGVRAFQKKYGITGEDGVIGPKTSQELNQLYSNSSVTL